MNDKRNTAEIIEACQTNDRTSSATRRADLVAAPYAWPGGYPRFACTTDGGALCSTCCSDNAAEIDGSYGDDGWMIETLDVNWEDTDMICDHCGDQIESAYGERIER